MLILTRNLCDFSTRLICLTFLDELNTLLDEEVDCNSFWWHNLQNQFSVVFNFIFVQFILGFELFHFRNVPLLIMIPNSSRRKLIFVSNFFSPPSPSMTKTLFPEFKNSRTASISDSVNFFLGPAMTRICPVAKDSWERTLVFLEKNCYWFFIVKFVINILWG